MKFKRKSPRFTNTPGRSYTSLNYSPRTLANLQRYLMTTNPGDAENVQHSVMQGRMIFDGLPFTAQLATWLSEGRTPKQAALEGLIYGFIMMSMHQTFCGIGGDTHGEYQFGKEQCSEPIDLTPRRKSRFEGEFERFRLADTVPTAAYLPTSAKPGDGYLTQDTGHVWLWSKNAWVDAGTPEQLHRELWDREGEQQ
jgi:hypothetical protein